MMEIINKFIEKFLRECRKITDFIPIAVFQMLRVVLGGSLISSIIFAIPGVNNFLASLVYSESMVEFLKNYLLFIGIWIVVLLAVILPPGNRPMLKGLRFRLKGFLVGLLLGFGTNGFAVLMSWLAGDIKLSFGGFDFVVLAVFAISVFIQSGAEEISDRFYLYQKLRRRYRSPLVAILVNSLAFSLMHRGNPGFTFMAGRQIFRVGLVFSLMVHYYDNLWGAMAFHAAWNYTQNIIFGLPNSGIVSEYSIFTLEAASARNGLFYNVNFGVEGSIGATAMLFVLAAVIIYINRNKHERNDIWAEEEEKAIQKRQIREQNNMESEVN